jgi:CheY-like chemotaxis protein
MGVSGKIVLIVDDAADSRLLTRRIVENAGMIAVEAPSVKEAFERVESQLPHLILLDLRMDGASGFDFLARKRDERVLADVPVVVISAASDRDSIYRALGLGACDYVIKPITAWHLMQKVRKALKDQSFKVARFKDGPERKLVVSFPAEISKPAETAFFLGSAVKIGAGTRVSLQSRQLEELALGECVFVAEGKPNVRGLNGLYFTRVNIMGLSRPLTRIIKKAKVG